MIDENRDKEQADRRRRDECFLINGSNVKKQRVLLVCTGFSFIHFTEDKEHVDLIRLFLSYAYAGFATHRDFY